MDKKELNGYTTTFWTFCDKSRGRLRLADAVDVCLVLFFLNYISSAGGCLGVDGKSRSRLSRALKLLGLAEDDHFKKGIGELGDSLAECLPKTSEFGVDAREAVIARLESARAVDPSFIPSILTFLVTIEYENLTRAEASQVFQEVIDRKSESAAEMTTPSSIRRLMIDLLPNRAEISCYDPVCGYGSLLREVFLRRKGTAYGQDINQSTLLIGFMNLYLSCENLSVTLGDTLLAPNNVERGNLEKFDVVLAHPPFGMRLDSHMLTSDRYERFSVALPSASETAFLLHARASMRPDGHAVIVVPSGILFRSGADSEVRKSLVESGELEAVVQLPPYLFGGTAIAAALLILNGSELAASGRKVVFVSLTEFADGAKTQKNLTESGIRLAVQAIRERELIEGVSAFVSRDILEKNDFNLTPSTYVTIRNQEIDTFDESYSRFKDSVQKRNEAESKAFSLIDELNRLGVINAGGNKHD